MESAPQSLHAAARRGGRLRQRTGSATARPPVESPSEPGVNSRRRSIPRTLGRRAYCIRPGGVRGQASAPAGRAWEDHLRRALPPPEPTRGRSPTRADGNRSALRPQGGTSPPPVQTRSGGVVPFVWLAPGAPTEGATCRSHPAAGVPGQAPLEPSARSDPLRRWPCGRKPRAAPGMSLRQGARHRPPATAGDRPAPGPVRDRASTPMPVR